MKAILVIDVPDKYIDRDIYVLHEIYTYEGNRYERIEEYKEGVHKLKPMPQRRYSLECGDSDGNRWKETSEYDNGYNACIDELLGVEDER